MTRTAYTLFTGGGGADLGLRAAGYTLLGGIEYDPKLAAVYRANLGAEITVADVRAVEPELLPGPAPDWLHASPVCKNFSAAKAGGEEDSGDLAMADAVARFLAAWRPSVFSLEQVYAYRNSASFGRIRAALVRLGYAFEYWHLNAADYGVPQTRRRMVLLARLGEHRIQRPEPTHSQAGDMFAAPWVGWYAAIEDLISTLPPSHFAQWQLDRLPALMQSTLLSSVNGDGTTQPRSAAAPSFAVQATAHKAMPRAFIVEGTQGGASNGYALPVRGEGEPVFTLRAAQHKGMPRAFIVDGQPAPGGERLTIRSADEPAATVAASGDKRPTRAWLVESRNTGQERGDGLREEHEPATTITTDTRPSHWPKALLVGDQAASGGRAVIARAGDEPAMTLRSGEGGGGDPRAWLGRGRVVKMNLRALARFQSFPDSYVPRSTVEIGNAVPPLLMQRLAESIT